MAAGHGKSVHKRNVEARTYPIDVPCNSLGKTGSRRYRLRIALSDRDYFCAGNLRPVEPVFDFLAALDNAVLLRQAAAVGNVVDNDFQSGVVSGDSILSLMNPQS